MTMQLRIVCAWCKTVQQEGTAGAPESHTICAACFAKHFPDQEPMPAEIKPEGR